MLLFAGCGRPPSTGPIRLALLPAAVLIGDPAQQSLATAVPLVLQQDLATSALLFATFVSSSSTAYQLEATKVARTVVEQQNGKFRVQATITSTDTQQTTEVLVQEGPVKAGIIPLLDALAKKLDPAKAGPFSTRSDEALRLFAAAVDAPAIPARTQLLDQTIQADPTFGLAQIARVENTATLPDSKPVPTNAFVPIDQARWAALIANAHHVPLSDQIKAQAAVVQLAPNNVEALATLGFYHFLQGNQIKGEQSLRQAIALNPTNTNLSLQLAQGLVAVKQFSAAIRILTPLTANNPNLLPSLALTQLLDGNTAGADATFKRFLSFLPASNPALEAQWQRFTNPAVPAASTGGIDAWQSAVTQSGDTNLPARSMLALSLELAGRTQEAQAIHVQPFIPEFTDANAPAAFNQMRRRLQRK